MTRTAIFLISACLSAALSVASPALAKEAPAPLQQSAGAPRMLPARTLSCTLGRALNLDPTIAQTVADIRYEGAHAFRLHLPAIPSRVGPLPSPDDAPEPVHPETRVVFDPSGLARDMKGPFSRVVDMWPQRVEMIAPVDAAGNVRLIIISDIDVARGAANLFMTVAADAASMDLDRVYQGGCRIALPSAVQGKAHRSGRRRT